MAEFPNNTCSFLADLTNNNSKDWFAANRMRYEREWLQPAMNYVTNISHFMETLFPPHKAVAKVNHSIRRLHRDMRFAKDKTPFDPKLHLIFWTGDHPLKSPAIHIVLHANRLGIGAGEFNMSPGKLAAYRSVISKQEKELKSLNSILKDLGQFDCILTPETLKKIPRGFEVATGDETLLKRKGLVIKNTSASLPTETICNVDTMSELFTQLARMNNWLAEYTQ